MPSRHTAATSRRKPRPEGRAYRGMDAGERRAERHDKLIDAGLEVFGTLGYHAATVRAVCAEAGLTERYFYESFDNAEALLCAVYQHLIASATAKVNAALARAGKDTDALSRAALRAYYRDIRDPRVARVMLFEVLGVSERVDKLYRQAMEDFGRLIRTVSQAVHAQRTEGAFNDELISAGLVGATVQIAMRWTLGGYRETLDEVVSSTLTIFSAVNARLLAQAS